MIPFDIVAIGVIWVPFVCSVCIGTDEFGKFLIIKIIIEQENNFKTEFTVSSLIIDVSTGKKISIDLLENKNKLSSWIKLNR